MPECQKRHFKYMYFVIHDIINDLTSFDFSAKKEYVTGVDISITEKYLNGTYQSCSRVSVPSIGKLALDMMCGDWGASRCSPKKWFEFMGDAEGNAQFVPFQITYITTPLDGYSKLDPTITPCSKAINVRAANDLFFETIFLLSIRLIQFYYLMSMNLE